MNFFIRNEIGIFLLEVKFKYPYRDFSNNVYYYGINKLQAMALNYFYRTGFRVYNVILNNLSKTDVVDFLERYSQKAVWLIARFPGLEKLELYKAPARTSYFGNTEQEFYRVEADKYQFLDKQYNCFSLICPKCGSKLLLRHRNIDKAEFLGCSNYHSKGCKGTISLG